ncbi:MAG TPA: SdiA-regulated domain-containing protein [Terriglobales bacterium]|nr:SdiA-regulated domain-containing protein [Terriglobales bacterium]
MRANLVNPANAIRPVRKTRLADYALAFQTTALPTIAGNCSAAAFCPVTDTFIVSDNGVPVLHEFRLDGTYRRQITLSGFTDVESVCWIEGDRFAIAEEGNPTVVNAISEVQIPATGVVTITKGAGNWIRTINTGIVSGGNLALEGVTYDATRQKFYCVTEKANAGVWNVWQVARGGGATTQLFSLNGPMTGVGTDVSDLHYDPVEDILYVLSQEGFKVIKMSMSGQILDTLATPAAFPQPEGLCLSPDLSLMIVTGEARCYARYQLNPAKK